MIVRKVQSFDMADMKYKYYSKIYKTTFGMTKHISMYKMRQKTAYYIISRNILNKINDFSMAKVEVMLPFEELIRKKKVHI